MARNVRTTAIHESLSFQIGLYVQVHSIENSDLRQSFLQALCTKKRHSVNVHILFKKGPSFLFSVKVCIFISEIITLWFYISLWLGVPNHNVSQKCDSFPISLWPVSLWVETYFEEVSNGQHYNFLMVQAACFGQTHFGF